MAKEETTRSIVQIKAFGSGKRRCEAARRAENREGMVYRKRYFHLDV